MNNFPTDFNPKELRKRSDEFQKQASELRSNITKGIDVLSGKYEVNIEKYGMAVVDEVKKELESIGWKCEVYEKQIRRTNEKFLRIGY